MSCAAAAAAAAAARRGGGGPLNWAKPMGETAEPGGCLKIRHVGEVLVVIRVDWLKSIDTLKVEGSVELH